MISKYILPLLAAAGLSFGIFVVMNRSEPPPSRPYVPPPTRPKEFRSIAGAGIVEPKLENIPIGAPVPGVVWEVFVKINQYVKKGDPLFRLEDRAVKAELKVKEAMLASAEAQYRKLKLAPRPEDVPIYEAEVEISRAKSGIADLNARRSGNLFNRGAGAESDYDKDRFTAMEAKATFAKSEADLRRLKKGTWEEDLLVAEAAVIQARSQLEQTQIELERLTVRALTDGQVLQVNVRPGQFAGLVWKEALIYIGDVQRLHVRVDIDEQDLPLFSTGTKAIATLKGRPGVRFDLTFVKIEPYVIPKKSLTGDNSERVDTRVLQAIYALPDERAVPIYVGQQMDVYIEAGKVSPGLALDADPTAPKPFEEEKDAIKEKTAAK